MTKHILPMKVGPLAPKDLSPILTIIIVLVILGVMGALGFGVYSLIRSSEEFCGCNADLPNESTGITIK